MFFSRIEASFLKRENFNIYTGIKYTINTNSICRPRNTQHGEHIYVLNDNNMTTFKHAIMSDG